MGLIDRDYMNEDRRRAAVYNPREFRGGISGADRTRAWTGRPKKSLWSHLFRWLVFGICLFAGYRLLSPHVSAMHRPLGLPQVPVPIMPATPEAFPRPGSAHYYAPVQQARLVSSVKISAEAGDAAYKHVVRLQTANDKRPIVDLYLVPGQQVDVGLPVGDFEAVTFVGERWFGREAMFGRGNPGKVMANIFHAHPGASFSISLGAPVYIPQ